MSIDKKKKFVMKHTFTDVMNLPAGVHHFGPQENHFGVPWCFSFYRSGIYMDVNLEYKGIDSGKKWSIDTTIGAKMLAKSGEEIIEKKRVFAKNDLRKSEWLLPAVLLEEYVVDGNVKIECEVTIHEMIGIEIPILRSFDGDSAKELSDVVLKVEDQKFYVLKKYLAAHSTYFKSLFLGNFEESKQSEIELKDIEPENFQKFLEVIYGEPAIDESYIEEILQLADMYDARTVIRRCEQFYLQLSQQNLKIKFNMATKYNMDQLKKKCISELRSVEDIEDVIPEDRTHLNKETCLQLLDLAIAHYKNN